MDKELDLLLVGRKKSRGRVGDLLAKIIRRDGEVQFFLIHVEPQAQRDNSFAERMYVGNYRIRDKFNVPVTSLAVFVDTDPSFLPNQFYENMNGTITDFDFLPIKCCCRMRRN